MTEEIKERIRLILFVLSLFIIVAVTVLMLKTLNMTRQKLKAPEVVPTPTPTSGVVSDFEPQSISDGISAIEADLKATDFSKLDQELEGIEAELEVP